MCVRCILIYLKCFFVKTRRWHKVADILSHIFGMDIYKWLRLSLEDGIKRYVICGDIYIYIYIHFFCW